MLSITAEERRVLRAQAHALKPVVMIAENGLSASVMQEIDRSLAAHGLIKIRVFSDDRELRETQLEEICTAHGAAPVQHIGKLLVIWRPLVDDGGKKLVRPRAPRQTKRSFQGGER